MSNFLKVTYTSEWEWVENNEDKVTTDAILNLMDGTIEAETSDLNCDGLIKEYIEYEDHKFYTTNDSGVWRVDYDDLDKIKKLVAQKDN